MFSIYGGKTEFKQWETDQLVTCPCMKEGDDVVFSAHGKAYETTAFVQNGEVLADVPNFLLQKPGSIRIDLGWGLDVHMDCRTYLVVTAQDKPEDYVCSYNIKYRPGKSGGGVSSWNDLTDKPFYEETGMVEVLAEGEATILDSQDEISQATLPLSLVLNANETYMVTYNGTEYTCTAQDFTDMGEGAIGLGDFTAQGLAGNGEPFALMYAPAMYSADGYSGIVMANDGNKINSISIYHNATVIHPIEGKYLPKGTPWVEESEAVEILPECRPTYDEESGAFIYESEVPFVTGDNYTINWNGVSYVCTYTSCLGNSSVMGGEDTGEPFCIFNDSGVCVIVPLDGTTELTISIYCMSVTIHKIDARCLPDGPSSMYNVYFTVDSGGNATTEQTYEEVFANATNPKIEVRAIITNEDNAVIFAPLSCYEGAVGAGYMVFSCVYYAMSATKSHGILWSSDGTIVYEKK